MHAAFLAGTAVFVTLGAFAFGVAFGLALAEEREWRRRDRMARMVTRIARARETRGAFDPEDN